MVAAAAAPCGGTGREGRVAGGGRLRAHRPYGARVSTGARAAQKVPNPNFGSRLGRSLPLLTAGAIAIRLYVIGTRAPINSNYWARSITHVT